jgi:hypothetical protein
MQQVLGLADFLRDEAVRMAVLYLLPGGVAVGRLH